MAKQFINIRHDGELNDSIKALKDRFGIATNTAAVFHAVQDYLKITGQRDFLLEKVKTLEQDKKSLQRQLYEVGAAMHTLEEIKQNHEARLSGYSTVF